MAGVQEGPNGHPHVPPGHPHPRSGFDRRKNSAFEEAYRKIDQRLDELQDAGQTRQDELERKAEAADQAGFQKLVAFFAVGITVGWLIGRLTNEG